jgi:hypothetical protein
MGEAHRSSTAACLYACLSLDSDITKDGFMVIYTGVAGGEAWRSEPWSGR